MSDWWGYWPWLTITLQMIYTTSANQDLCLADPTWGERP